jgi:hypothetical protein
MKDFSQIRLSLAEITHTTSNLKNYYTHIQRLFSSVDTIKEQDVEYLINLITSETFLKSQDLVNASLAWSKLSHKEASTIFNCLKQIISINEELSINKNLITLQDYLPKLKELWGKWYQLTPQIIEEVKKEYKKLSTIHFFNAKSWSSSQKVVFHGVRLDYVGTILEENKIKGYTTQRYWEDGRRRTDADFDYNESLWMKGISTTRTLDFAANWAGVVLVLNLDKIKANTEVVPFAWNYHISKGSGHFKKETEEFVVLKKTGKQFKKIDNPNFKEEYDEIMGFDFNEMSKEYSPEELEDFRKLQEDFKKKSQQSDIEGLKVPEGELDISNCLMGIFIAGHTIDIYGLDNPVVQQIINHDKFIGVLEV